MDSQTWQTTLTATLDPNDLQNMRAWLLEYAPPVPSRNADVLSKFAACTLRNNAQWNGLLTQWAVSRSIQRLPWEQGYQGDSPVLACDPPPRLWLPLRLAVGGFALLVMLAAIAIPGARYIAHAAHVGILCDTLGHAPVTSVGLA